jgi:hypothetical protein
VSKLTQTALLVLVGLVILASVTPELTKLVNALVPFTVTAGIVIAVVRIAWAATRRW